MSNNIKNKKPTKIEQIKVLVEPGNQKHELAAKYNIKTWEDLLTVTRSEILDYVKSNYKIEDIYADYTSIDLKYEDIPEFVKKVESGEIKEESGYFNLRRESGRYVVFTWDYDFWIRTGKVHDIDEDYFDTENELYECYVDGIIRGSGTGINFADKEGE